MIGSLVNNELETVWKWLWPNLRYSSAIRLEDRHKYLTENSRLWTEVSTLDSPDTKPEWYLPTTFSYVEIDGMGGRYE
jgi:hypothetical protein